jgi:hypothetical protein
MRKGTDVTEIHIPLKHVSENEVGDSAEYHEMILQEYAVRYLAALGVTPSPATKAMVTKCMPLKECQIHASWGRSAVADTLTIVPPSGKVRRADALRQGPADMDRRQIEWIWVAPPVGADVNRKDHDKVDVQKEMAKAEAKLRAADAQIVDLEKGSLTKDLERQRQLRVQEARGHERNKAGSELSEERRQRHNAEVEALKGFLLPFAACGPDGLQSWRDPKLSLELPVSDALRKEAGQPVQVAIADLDKELRSYVTECLPLGQLTTDPISSDSWRPRRRKLLRLLQQDQMVRLCGLLTHFTYWTALGHLSSGLPDHYKHALFIAIHEVWSDIEKLKATPWGASFVLPVHLLVLKRCVIWCFQTQYPTLMKDTTWKQLCARTVNVITMRLLDPENRYSKLGIFEVSTAGIKLRRQLSLVEAKQGWTASQQTIATLHRASTLATTLLQDALDPQTRKLLAKSKSVAQQDPRVASHLVDAGAKAVGCKGLKGTPDLSSDWVSNMRSDQRVALFSCARGRTRLGAPAHETKAE